MKSMGFSSFHSDFFHPAASPRGRKKMWVVGIGEGDELIGGYEGLMAGQTRVTRKTSRDTGTEPLWLKTAGLPSLVAALSAEKREGICHLT